MSARDEAESGFSTTSVLLAGSIPMPTLLACLSPLVLRSPVLVKSASRDPVTPQLVANSIAEVDAELGRSIAVVEFPGSDVDCMRVFASADCVVATGSDETVAELAAHVPAPREPTALSKFDIQRFRPMLVHVEVHERNREVLADYFAKNEYRRLDEYPPYDQTNWYFTPNAGN